MLDKYKKRQKSGFPILTQTTSTIPFHHKSKGFVRNTKISALKTINYIKRSSESYVHKLATFSESDFLLHVRAPELNFVFGIILCL